MWLVAQTIAEFQEKYSFKCGISVFYIREVIISCMIVA